MTNLYIKGIMDSWDAVSKWDITPMADPYTNTIKIRLVHLIADHLDLPEDMIVRMINDNRDLLLQLQPESAS